MNLFTYKKTLAAFLIVLAIITTILIFQWRTSVDLPGEDADVCEVQIKSGMTCEEVGELLYHMGIIRSVFCFKIVASIHGFSWQLKAGNHLVSEKKSLTELARMLTQNPSHSTDIRVTVIEGLTLYETASVLASRAGIDSTSFISLALDRRTAEKLGIDNNTLEGYLYPDTYFVRPGTEPIVMITRMVERFKTVFNDSLRNRASEIGMTVNEVITLASIIENEASGYGERLLISAVFHKRLKLNLPLEANPTVQYVIGTKRRLLYDDLKIESPYNTYIHAGLPPGPIANPGKASLLAALYPADTKYLYFVSDGKDGHVFSRTISEHIRAVNRYKRIRKNN